MHLLEFLPKEELEVHEKELPPNDTPLWLYWPEFVEKYLRTGKSEVTVKGVRDGLRYAVRQLKIYSIQQLNNPRLVEEALFQYQARHHIKNNTYNSYRKNFNTYCLWLEKMEYIEKNNIMKVDKCTVEHDEHLTLTDEQVKLVVAYIHDRKQTRLELFRNIFFIDLARYTGARPCELLGLKVKDISRFGNTYRLALRGRKQKGRIRYYEFSSFLQASYETYMNYRSAVHKNEEYLFISCSRRTGWTYAGVKKLFQKMSKDLGFLVTLYSFRRYVATRLYNEGKSLERIADYLGHTRTATTRRYIAQTCALTKDCGDLMGRE